MSRDTSRNVVLIGYGESEDPLPEQPQLTRYRVFAGPCKDCGCVGRKIAAGEKFLVIICDKCHSGLQTTIPAIELPEVTYIYWCNNSKFASDEIELSPSDREMIEQIERLFPEKYEVPHWAVTVIGGRCSSSEMCVNFACSYLIKSQ